MMQNNSLEELKKVLDEIKHQDMRDVLEKQNGNVKFLYERAIDLCEDILVLSTHGRKTSIPVIFRSLMETEVWFHAILDDTEMNKEFSFKSRDQNKRIQEKYPEEYRCDISIKISEGINKLTDRNLQNTTKLIKDNLSENPVYMKLSKFVHSRFYNDEELRIMYELCLKTTPKVLANMRQRLLDID